MTDWVRLWHDMPTDPKWRVIARKSGQPLPAVIAVFTMMMCNASSNAEERGALIGWDDEDVGAALDMDASDVLAIRTAMQSKVLDGDHLSGWDRRQPKREDNSVGRVKAYRDRKRAECNACEQPETPAKRNVTHGNAPETDAETDKKELEAKASCPSGDERDGNPDENQDQEPTLKPEHVVESWNALAERLGKPKVRNLTPERRVALKARIAGYSLGDFREVLGSVERSPFLRGDKGWPGCTFDWITKKKNFQKILEGNYNV